MAKLGNHGERPHIPVTQESPSLRLHAGMVINSSFTLKGPNLGRCIQWSAYALYPTLSPTSTGSSAWVPASPNLACATPIQIDTSEALRKKTTTSISMSFNCESKSNLIKKKFTPPYIFIFSASLFSASLLMKVSLYFHIFSFAVVIPGLNAISGSSLKPQHLGGTNYFFSDF